MPKNKYTKKFKQGITKIKAKDFVTRADLDAFITCEYNHQTKENKENVVIEGTAQELKEKSLSDLTTISGIKTRII